MQLPGNSPGLKEDIMTHLIEYSDYQEFFEYHGNTAIERTRMLNGEVAREWIYFDTAEEAADFFYEQCN
jgi:hypothetical protein